MISRAVLFLLGLFLSIEESPAAEGTRPFAEYEKTSTIALAWTPNPGPFANGLAVREVVKALPEDVELILLIKDGSDIAAAEKELATLTRAKYSIWIDGYNHYGTDSEGELAIWLRDALPFPVVDTDTGRLAYLADQTYHWEQLWEPDSILSRFFQVPLRTEGEKTQFEHGNLLSDSTGRCFTMSRWGATGGWVSDDVFKELYGCRSIITFPFHEGVGHIDERIKIIDDRRAMTDTPLYAEILTKEGFQVTLVPKPDPHYKPVGRFSQMRTYMNSILVNGRVLLPIYQQPTDLDAIRAHQEMGLEVVPIDSTALVDTGGGSLHCVSMTFPEAK